MDLGLWFLRSLKMAMSSSFLTLWSKYTKSQWCSCEVVKKFIRVRSWIRKEHLLCSFLKNIQESGPMQKLRLNFSDSSTIMIWRSSLGQDDTLKNFWCSEILRCADLLTILWPFSTKKRSVHLPNLCLKIAWNLLSNRWENEWKNGLQAN